SEFESSLADPGTIPDRLVERDDPSGAATFALVREEAIPCADIKDRQALEVFRKVDLTELVECVVAGGGRDSISQVAIVPPVDRTDFIHQGSRRCRHSNPP